MAARPPRRDTDGPDAIEFGIPALQPHLEEAEIEFPATGDQVVAGLGDPGIPIDAHGRTVPLSTAMDDLRGEEFESERALLDALHPVFERYRERTSSGLVSSIRGLLPF